jgi:hypothetical protein
MSLLARIGSGALYRALWGLQGSPLPDALRQLVLDFVFHIFPFQESLCERVVTDYSPKHAYRHMYGRDVILIKTTPPYLEYSGVVLPLSPLWEEGTNNAEVIAPALSIKAVKFLPVEWVDDEEDIPYIQTASRHHVISQQAPGYTLRSFPTFRSKCILVAVILEMSADMYTVAEELIGASNCTDRERRCLFAIAEKGLRRWIAPWQTPYYPTYWREDSVISLFDASGN